MLVIVSDFHFSDGTAVPANWNVNPRGIELLLRDVYRQATRKRVKELYLVLLGDMFDTLRSEAWLDVPLHERPWGDPRAMEAGFSMPEAARQHARQITRRIIAQNQAALDLLAGRPGSQSGERDGELVPPPGLSVRRVFIPGNHDRLYLCDSEVRRLTREALGSLDETAASAEGIYPHHLAMPRYGLLARHGHEHDPWNFERHHAVRTPATLATDLGTWDYQPVPIGDPITTELVVGFPHKIRHYLQDSGKFRPEQIRSIIERIQRIEDVRPTMAAFRWVFYEAELLTQEDGSAAEQLSLSQAQQLLLGEILGEALRELSVSFGEMPYYQAWRDLHNHIGCDVPEQIDLALLALRHTGPRTVARFLGLWDRLATLVRPLDSVGIGAASEPALPSGYPAGMRYIVYGHTHEPKEYALPRRRPSGGDLRYTDLYLNSGTWRDRVFAADGGIDFARWRSATYIILYTEEENQPSVGPRRIGPAFDSWTGHRAND
jgi:hypothetical protein